MYIRGIIRSTLPPAVVAVLTFPSAGAVAARVAGMHVTETTYIAGPYRVVLMVLPPEPFYTRAQVEQKQVKAGMLIVGGAAAIQPDDASHPNHHLIAHIYERATGKAVRGAHVTLTYARVNAGAVSGPAVKVPIVEMQTIGKGPESTH